MVIPKYTVPYSILVNQICYQPSKYGGNYLDAMIDDVKFGSIKIPYDKMPGESDIDIIAFKVNVRRLVAGFSSTVKLRTRCRCEQIADIGPGNTWRIAIPITPKLDLDVNHADVMSMPCAYREFKWRGNYCPEIGIRIFDEVH